MSHGTVNMKKFIKIGCTDFVQLLVKCEINLPKQACKMASTSVLIKINRQNIKMYFDICH